MTTIKLNLRELLTEAIGDDYVHIPATVDPTEVLEFTDADECERNLHELLHENRLIAHVWSVKDVQSVRPDLNADQAWEVLLGVEKRLDCTLGITWQTIEDAAIARFGERNSRRSERFQQALDVYEEPELTDLLTDALHWCQANGTSFDDALRLARFHFECEVGEAE